MTERENTERALSAAPHAPLRERLLAIADELAAGREVKADALRAAVDGWWDEQLNWEARLALQLGLHHEINNALVGVRGNAQLLMMGVAGQDPVMRDRLEVILRESARIKEAAVRLRAIKAGLHGNGPAARAA